MEDILSQKWRRVHSGDNSYHSTYTSELYPERVSNCDACIAVCIVDVGSCWRLIATQSSMSRYAIIDNRGCLSLTRVVSCDST